MRLPALTRIVVAAALAAGCGGSQSDGDLVFGEHESVCAPTVLANEPGDAAAAAIGSECFLREVQFQRTVVWDVRSITVEGDAIPTRYEFDGSVARITVDNRRDEFGNGGVAVEVCRRVVATEWLPEGVDCSADSGAGFSDDGLP